MKRTKHMSKYFAIIISIVMIMSLMIPVSAAAYDTSGATSFAFSNSGITVSEGSYSGYKVDGTALTIKDSGTYIVSGSCQNGTIVVKKNVTGVTLVLNGLTLSASATAPITCNKGSGVTIVAAAGTVNKLADDKYNNDDIYTDETLYPDIENAVIKCKDGSNVTICGTGTIHITANGKNGIKGGYDLYEEDADGNATTTLLSTASLSIKEVTLNITANVNDGLKSDKELNILSGNITISATDDGIKSDYVLTIGAKGTDGPTINIKKSAEGIEAATLNIYSGNITVNATDDGINAANADLSNYSFSYNQYGGSVYVNVTNGDGIDSNGKVNLMGGTVEIYSPAQGDGDPIDADGGTTFGGATVLAVGHMAMQQAYSATTPYVVFGGGSGGMMGGFGGQMGTNASNLVTAGSTIQITDASGNVLYSAKAIRNASYVLFAGPKLTTGTTYTLKNGSTTASTATAGNAASGGMGMGGQMPGNMGGKKGQMPGSNGTQGQMPGQSGNQSGMQGGRANGGFPGQGSESSGSVPTSPSNNGGSLQTPDRSGNNSGMTTLPDNGQGTPPALPDGETPPEMSESDENGFQPQMPGNGERPELPDNGGEKTDAQPEQPIENGAADQPEESTNWFMSIINAIRNFFRSLFGKA